MKTLLRFILPVAIGVLLGLGIKHLHTPVAQAAPIKQTVKLDSKPAGVPSAYGFYANMSVGAFNAAKQALDRGQSPFVRGFHTLSPDGKTVNAIGLAFPSADFIQVAKEVAAENGGQLTCRQLNVILCEVKDAAGNEVFLVSKAFQNKAGDTFGALLIADKLHMGPTNHEQKQPDSQVHLVPGQNEVTFHKYGNV